MTSPDPIDLEPHEYRGQGIKGEPFFAPGAKRALIIVAIFTAFWVAYSFTVGDWLVDWYRSIFPPVQ